MAPLSQYKILVERFCCQCQKSLQIPNYRRNKAFYYCSRQCKSEHLAARRLAELSWNPSPEVSAYIAGILDGEGCVTIIGRKQKSCTRTYAHLSVQIINTEMKLFEFIKLYLPSTIGVDYKSKKEKSHFRDCYRMIFTHVRAIVFLKPLIPYLIIKKEQALLGIEFQMLPLMEREFDARGADYAHRMRVLNKTDKRYPVLKSS